MRERTEPHTWSTKYKRLTASIHCSLFPEEARITGEMLVQVLFIYLSLTMLRLLTTTLLVRQQPPPLLPPKGHVTAACWARGLGGRPKPEAAIPRTSTPDTQSLMEVLL